MSKKFTYIFDLQDRISSKLSAVNSSFTKVNKNLSQNKLGIIKLGKAFKGANSKINLLPKSISNLENRLVELKQAQKNAFSTQSIRAYEKEIKRTERELAKMNSHKQKKGLSQKVSYLGNELGSQIPALGGLAASISSPIALAGAAAFGTYKLLKNASSKAIEFDAGMAKVNGTLQLQQDELKGLKGQLIDLGRNSSTNLQKIPDAFYKIASATGGDLPASLDILKSSLKGVDTGFGYLNQIADATVNMMNSIGRSDTNAAEVSDVLFASLNKGKVEFSELANYLPQLIPVSNNLGVSFKETAGVFAFLTANGLKAEQSATALKNVYKSMGTERIRKNFSRLGISIFDSSGKMRSMGSIALDLNKQLVGLTDEQKTKKLESLGLDQESALGMSIMAAHAKDLGAYIDYVTNSAGELNKTVKATANPLRTWKKISNQINALMLKLGYSLLPVINTSLSSALSAIKGISDFFHKAYTNSELFRDSVSLAWKVVKGTFNSIFGVFPKVIAGFSAIGNKIGLTSTKIKAIFKGIESLYSGTKHRIMAIVEGAKAAFDILKKAWDALWSGDFGLVKSLRSNLTKAFDNAYNESLLGDKKPMKWSLGSGTTKTKKKTGNKTNNSTPDNTVLISGINSITSGCKQQKNITINLGKLQDAINIYSQTIDEGADELEGKINKVLLRVVNAANAI